MADTFSSFHLGSEEISRLGLPTHLAMPGNSRNSEMGPTKSGGSGSKVAQGEIRLMHRVAAIVSVYIIESKEDAGVPAEFLAALTANESGGDAHAKRFEPGVYQHLKSVAEGRVASYGSIVKSLLEKEIEHIQEGERALEAGSAGAPLTAEPSLRPATGTTGTSGSTQTDGHPMAPEGPQPDHPQASPAGAKAESYHAEHLTAAFSATCVPALSALEDEVIRRLATSWGLTQIMGYHVLGRPEPLERLSDPVYHYTVAARMIQDFAARFHLDPQRDFEALFRCWNTGRPDGKTYDPSYVERGMRRIEICRQLKAAPPVTAP